MGGALLKRVLERTERIWTGASVNNISGDAGRISFGHGWLAAMADRGSLIIFCTEREVEFLILQYRTPGQAIRISLIMEGERQNRQQKERCRKENGNFFDRVPITHIVL